MFVKFPLLAAHIDPLDNALHSALLQVLPDFMWKREQNSTQNLNSYFFLMMVSPLIILYLYLPGHKEPIGSNCESFYTDFLLMCHFLNKALTL